MSAGAAAGQPAAPGKPVKRTRELPEIGVTEWQLGNGVRVVLKPTDFKNDEILMTARSPGRPLAGVRPGLPLGAVRRRRGRRQRRRQLRPDRAAQGPERQGGGRQPLHRRAGGGPDRQRLARGPGDPAAARLPVRHRPARRRRGVRRLQGAAGRAGRPPAVRSRRRCSGTSGGRCISATTPPAPARPGAGSIRIQLAGDPAHLQGPLRRRGRHDLRVRGPDRPGQAAAAGGEVPGGAALPRPQGEVARRRGPPQGQRQALRARRAGSSRRRWWP